MIFPGFPGVLYFSSKCGNPEVKESAMRRDRTWTIVCEVRELGGDGTQYNLSLTAS